MPGNHKRLFTKTAPVLVALGLAGATLGTGQAGSTGGPLRCEIETSSTGGMVALEAVVLSDVPVSGSYRFRVASAGGGGGSNIQQGGGFTAAPDGAVTLGRVMLGAGAIYDASLEITANGLTSECSKRVGGAL